MQECTNNAVPQFAASDAAGVVCETKTWVRKFLWGWEGSAMSPDEASELIVSHVVGEIKAYLTSEERGNPAGQYRQSASPCV